MTYHKKSPGIIEGFQKMNRERERRARDLWRESFLLCNLTSTGLSNFRPKHWTKQVALACINFWQLNL